MRLKHEKELLRIAAVKEALAEAGPQKLPDPNVVHLTHKEILAKRKADKLEAEEAERRAQQDKFAALPEWKRASIIRKRDQAAGAGYTAAQRDDNFKSALR